jgi:hypothetical protein
MLRHGISLFLTLLYFAHARASVGDDLHFVALKRFEQKEGLPPTLVAFFDVDCGDKLVDTIRFEDTDANGVARIYVGGLVRSNPISSCVGEVREVSKAAGYTYSGRSFRVMPIEGPMAAKVVGGVTPAPLPAGSAGKKKK